MKKITPIIMLTLAAVVTSCVKPEEKPKEIRFSILGDSYSTYIGHVDPETNDVYPYDTLGFSGAEQMWWHIVAAKKGWFVDRNNSFSGSLVCNYDYVNYYGPYSYLRRMYGLGNPDVIFVFGATNDACAHNADYEPVVELGDFVYSGWTEEQLCTFRPALACLFDNLQRLYPNAEVYFMLDMDLGSGGITVARRDAFIESVHRVASHYGVRCIDLYAIHKSNWHPNVRGHKEIADQTLECLETDAL